MRKVVLAFFVLLAVAIIGGGVYLASWDVPPPSTTMEIDVPSARLSR